MVRSQIAAGLPSGARERLGLGVRGLQPSNRHPECAFSRVTSVQSSATDLCTPCTRPGACFVNDSVYIGPAESSRVGCRPTTTEGRGRPWQLQV